MREVVEIQNQCKYLLWLEYLRHLLRKDLEKITERRSLNGRTNTSRNKEK